ncbi:unnamed protein product [Moneuplotes crassus]|uniref:Uncharacterized protein n=1 Tax=Euplotes crassus TaxID=5936 RepID=A0AAD1UGZ8_EUPCR|nr:unnamed protein product [Moneuplotes crassus]
MDLSRLIRFILRILIVAIVIHASIRVINDQGKIKYNQNSEIKAQVDMNTDMLKENNKTAQNMAINQTRASNSPEVTVNNSTDPIDPPIEKKENTMKCENNRKAENNTQTETKEQEKDTENIEDKEPKNDQPKDNKKKKLKTGRVTIDTSKTKTKTSSRKKSKNRKSKQNTKSSSKQTVKAPNVNNTNSSNKSQINTGSEDALNKTTKDNNQTTVQPSTESLLPKFQNTSSEPKGFSNRTSLFEERIVFLNHTFTKVQDYICSIFGVRSCSLTRLLFERILANADKLTLLFAYFQILLCIAVIINCKQAALSLNSSLLITSLFSLKLPIFCTSYLNTKYLLLLLILFSTLEIVAFSWRTSIPKPPGLTPFLNCPKPTVKEEIRKPDAHKAPELERNL